MENLWAPWRMSYIDKNAVANEGCFFCNKFSAENDKENYVLERKKMSFSLLNIFPYNNGHVMVAPVRHVAKIDDFTEAEILEVFTLVKHTKILLQEKLNPDGFNIGVNCGAVAGAGIVDHAHIHIVPRWNGDTNFMPVIANIKVVPQSLDALFLKLTAKK